MATKVFGNSNGEIYVSGDVNNNTPVVLAFGLDSNDVDKAANDMHEKVVDEVKKKIKEAYINAQTSGTVQGTDN